MKYHANWIGKVSDICFILNIVYQIYSGLEILDEDTILYIELRKNVLAIEFHFEYFKGITKKIMVNKEN